MILSDDDARRAYQLGDLDADITMMQLNVKSLERVVENLRRHIMDKQVLRDGMESEAGLLVADWKDS